MIENKEQKDIQIEPQNRFNQSLANKTALSDKVFKIKLCGSSRELK